MMINILTVGKIVLGQVRT